MSPSTDTTTTDHTITIDGVGIFYREAGPLDEAMDAIAALIRRFLGKGVAEPRS